MFKAIQNNNYWNGVRHIFSPRTVSKYELVSMINETYDLQITINPFDAEIRSDKSISTIYEINHEFNIPDLKEQIEEMKEYKL